MERKVGEVFDLNGIKLRVKRTDNPVCDGCFLERFNCIYWQTNGIKEAGLCYGGFRSDKNNVIFVEVEEKNNEEAYDE